MEINFKLANVWFSNLGDVQCSCFRVIHVSSHIFCNIFFIIQRQPKNISVYLGPVLIKIRSFLPFITFEPIFYIGTLSFYLSLSIDMTGCDNKKSDLFK